MKWPIGILVMIGTFVLLTLIFDPSWASFELFPVVLIAFCAGFTALFLLAWAEETFGD